jgi:two-component system cell cycle response regulator
VPVDAPRVLIADDSPLVLRMIETMLQQEGLCVVTACDGLEAVEKSLADDVDLVILDVMMPRMNGYQACRLLKSEPASRALPVVILTSKDQPGDRFWGLETGADHYITKDAEPQRILELVKGILRDNPRSDRPRPAGGGGSSVDILSRVNELLDRKLYEATILSEMARVAHNLVQFDECFVSVMGLVARIVDFGVGAMAFVEEQQLEVFLMLQRPASPAVVDELKARLLEAVARERGGAGFRRVQARLFAPSGSAGAREQTQLLGFAAFPVADKEGRGGVLALGGKALAQLAPQTAELLRQVASQAHVVLDNSRLFERVRNLSIRDSLTDLFNHKHSMELLAQEFARAGRYDDTLSVLLMDIDHFKRVNDEHGHPAGDAVLRDVALVLRDVLRSVDAVGRYGGEEFIAILPHTGREEARRAAERVRAAVESHRFHVGAGELRITLSVGIASRSAHEVDAPAALVREADRALYQAKEAGRNGVA